MGQDKFTSYTVYVIKGSENFLWKYYNGWHGWTEAARCAMAFPSKEEACDYIAEFDLLGCSVKQLNISIES